MRKSPLLILLGLWLLCLTETLCAQTVDSRLEKFGIEYVYFEADVLISDAKKPPADSLGWTAEALPNWAAYNHEEIPSGSFFTWYRFELTKEILAQFEGALADDNLGIYLGRHLNSAQVFLENDFLGATGSDQGYQSRNWNQSSVWRAPIRANQQDSLYLYIRLYGYDTSGVILPVMLGSYDQLRVFVDEKQWRQVSIGRYIWILELAMMVFCAFIWWRRRDKTYGYLALTAFLVSIAALHSHAQWLPIHQEILLRVVHWSGDAATCMMVLFGRRFLGLKENLLDKFLWVYPLLLIFVQPLIPAQGLSGILNLLHLVTLSLLLYLFCLSLWRAIRLKSAAGWIFSIGILISFASYIHGVSLSLSQDLYRWATEFHTNSFAMLPLMLMLLIYIARQFVLSMDKLESMNAELEMRVDLVKAELDEAYNAKLEEERLLTAEQAREMAYRDLHDDLGARILSLVYSSETPLREDLARSALQDLRDVVSRNGIVQMNLISLLADCRFELTDRSERMDIDVGWADYDLSKFDLEIAAEQTLYLKQFFRELFGAVVSQTQTEELFLSFEMASNENSVEPVNNNEILVSVRSTSLSAADQRKVLTSHLLHRLSKLRGRIARQSHTHFDMRFTLAL